ncbi:MAG: hypothetical protein ACXWAT_07895 [Methylobacter sp.]
MQQLDVFFELIPAAIEAADWEGLNDLLLKRRAAMEQLCALPLSISEHKAAVSVMISMQTTDRQFLAEVKSQKDTLQKQVVTLLYDRKAIQAYQSE